MRIAVNTAGLPSETLHENAAYLLPLLRAMRELDEHTEFVILTSPGAEDVFRAWQPVTLGAGERSGSGFRRGGAGRPDHAAKQAGADVLFSPVWTAPPKPSVPSVLYALALPARDDKHPKARRADATAKTIRAATDAAAAIIVPSRFLQRQFLDLLDIPLDRVAVTHLGVDDIFGRAYPGFVEEPYILFVGGSGPSSNIERFMQAFARLENDVPHAVAVIGPPGPRERENWGPRVVRIEECPAPQRAALYQHCDLCVYPTLYDGSGATVLEAMRSGARLVASRTGAVAEVGGNVPTYFNADNLASMVAAIRRALLEDADERADRVRFGVQSAGAYSWRQCAWKTLAVLKRSVGS